MSKSANAGELRTPVFFMRINRSKDATDGEGFPIENEVNIFGKGKSIRTKWVNAHGSDVFLSLQMKLREPATITCRFSPKIKADQIVYRGNDPKPFEIISIDNVEEKNQWLEIKVQRRVKAR